MNILRFKDVTSKFGYPSRTSVYNAMRDGVLTTPISLGARAVGWPDYEINAVCAARIAGKTDADIRSLVTRLHQQRLNALGMVEA